MGFVEDNHVPAGPVRPDRLLHGGVHGRQFQARQPTCRGRLQTRARGPSAAVIRRSSPPKNRAKSACHFVTRCAGATTSARLTKPSRCISRRYSPGHDRLAGARLIGEQEPQAWLRQHRPVDCVHLVRVRLQRRRRQCRRPRPRAGRPHPGGPQPGQDCARIASPSSVRVSQAAACPRQRDLWKCPSAPQRIAASHRP